MTQTSLRTSALLAACAAILFHVQTPAEIVGDSHPPIIGASGDADVRSADDLPVELDDDDNPVLMGHDADAHLWVFAEAECVALGEPSEVRTPAGSLSSPETLVDSHFVQFLPSTDATGSEPDSVEATIEFSNDIVAVLWRTADLDATDAALGLPADQLIYPSETAARRGPEFFDGDEITFEGCRTVVVRFVGAGPGDAIRVLTRASCIGGIWGDSEPRQWDDLPVDPEADNTLLRDGRLYAFDERQGHVLESALEFRNLDREDVAIAAETIVDSHYISFIPSDTATEEEPDRVDGSLQFDGEIIAVLWRGEDLLATDETVGLANPAMPRVSYPTAERRAPERSVDVVQIEGCNSVRVSFVGAGPGDGIRVLTLADAPNTAPELECSSVFGRVRAGSTLSVRTVDFRPVVTDDDPVELTIDEPGPFEIGTHIVVLTATDRNGNEASCEAAVTVVERPRGIEFVRGDANQDRRVDLGDAVFVLSFLFTGGRRPLCEQSADINSDLTVDIADPVHLLQFLFLGGRAPSHPFPDCGVDDVTRLSCEFYDGCS